LEKFMSISMGGPRSRAPEYAELRRSRGRVTSTPTRRMTPTMNEAAHLGRNK
jgi:hypothetical protein